MTEEPTCDLPTAETGFTALDYRDLRQQLERAVVTRNEKATRAILSNNVNTILGALQDAVADKWQPIGTYDHTLHEHCILICGRYKNGLAYVEDAYYRRHGRGGARWGRTFEPPTHWMPLPEPPAP